ncbi:hypothetical protein [Serratia phage PCH45]|uniref:hypothetical protein n=1 Tax=Serratia phage PCH45 TaxID=2608368 RepID=UPI0012AA55E7|nr:hypothetical protein [Serratia phage PCH45]
MDGSQVVRVIVALAASTFMFAWLLVKIIERHTELKVYIEQKAEYLLAPKRDMPMLAVSFIMPSIPVAMVNNGIVWSGFFLAVTLWAILSDMFATKREGDLSHYKILAWSYSVSFSVGILTMAYCLIFE